MRGRLTAVTREQLVLDRGGERSSWTSRRRHEGAARGGGPLAPQGVESQAGYGSHEPELISVIEQIGREKGIDKEILFEAVESALQSACRKSHTGPDNVRIEIDRKTGEFSAFLRKRVVDEVADSETEISLKEAKKLNAEAELDVELEIKQERPPQDLGRIAAQTAKQVILQGPGRRARGHLLGVRGEGRPDPARVVHRIEKRNVILEIGKAEAILPEREQIPGERYNPGDRIRAYVLEVRRIGQGPADLAVADASGLPRAAVPDRDPRDPGRIVLVKATAREAGERAKVAVASTKRDVDPIGACVGLRGTRIQVISRELRGEKIDIIEWSHDPATFVARALSPAKVSSVAINEAADRTASRRPWSSCRTTSCRWPSARRGRTRGWPRS